MRDRLTVYSQDTYEECLVSWPEEGAFGIALSGGLSGRPGGLRLELEVRNGVPFFLPCGGFSLWPAGGRRHFPLPVERERVYFLSIDGGGRLVLFVRAGSAAPELRRFALEYGTPFCVGAAPENQIVYHGGGAVSGVHAVFTRTADGCLLEDRSCNGVYVEGRRIRGSQRLNPSDQVHLCGLTLTYLGDSVSLDASIPGLTVQAGLTPLDELTDGQSRDYFEDETVFEGIPGSEDETVFEGIPSSEDETVFEGIPSSEEETVFERISSSEDETVFEGIPGSEDETVFEGIPSSEDETVFEGIPSSEDETVFEGIPGSGDETVFESIPDSEGKSVLEWPDRT